MASDPQVQEIKDRINIVEFINEYVKLTRAGSSYKARCPFHSEKTPSFMVSADRNTWHCFGCNEGGDIYSFLQKQEGLTFPEALKICADRAGVKLKRSAIPDHERSEASRLKDLLFDASQMYHTILLQAEGASEARSYLKDRGLDEKIIREFSIGFAPDKWDVLVKFLTKRGFGARELVKAGLAIKGDRGLYDRFRGRIMFPIYDHLGATVGFTGRLLKEGNEKAGGKYVNTPQTILFDKSKLLYGLDRAKSSIKKRGEAVIVEGQMDVIACHQYGFENTVASSGTALGEHQLMLLKRYTDKIKIAFDADQAGAKAALRGIILALQMGFDVRVINLQEKTGKDPDDCIRKDEREWKRAVEAAQPYIRWCILHSLNMCDVNEARGKREIVSNVLPFIVSLKSPVERDTWISELAQGVGLTSDVIYQEMKVNMSKKTSSKGSSRVLREKKPIRQIDNNPFVRLLALHLHLKREFSDLGDIPKEFFPEQFHPLYNSSKIEYSADTTIHLVNVLKLLHDRVYAKFSDEQLENEYKQLKKACILKTKKRQAQHIAKQVSDAEARGDHKRAAELLQNYQALRQTDRDR